MSETVESMSARIETPPTEEVVATSSETGTAEGGMEQLASTTFEETQTKKLDEKTLNTLFEAVNAPQPTHEQMNLLMSHTDVDGTPLSVWAEQRRAEQSTFISQDYAQEATVEKEQGLTAEEIEQMIKDETQRIFAEKVEELANIFLSFSDEDMDNIAVRGVPLSGERIVASGISLEPQLVQSILEALRDNKDLQALVEQIYGDIEEQARENVTQKIAHERAEQKDDSIAIEDPGEAVPVEEVAVIKAGPDSVTEDVPSTTQSSTG
jgi:hypothetical protein